MAKYAVIVESPAKAKTLSKILGIDYTIHACFGHIRDLPAKNFGIDIENDFKPTYKIISGRRKIISELKKATQDTEAIYIASDPDREGEAIAWHLVETLEIPDSKIKRVSFHEITKNAVLKAFESPKKISMELVNAQQARRLLDRIVGYKISPLLWKKIARGLSAGRVQSVAVKLVVDREKDINNFKPEEYWKITAVLSQKNSAETFNAELKFLDDKKEIKIKNKQEVEDVLQAVKNEDFIVFEVSEKENIVHPPPPFTTSLLQQQASIKLNFSAAKTMLIAQKLYEGIELGDEGSVALITYMRTDSFNVSTEAIKYVRNFISSNYGDKFLNENVRVFKSKKLAQEAHEAIRPTVPLKTPDSVRKYLTSDQFKLYELIWKRFTATQMKPAIFSVNEALIKAGNYIFVAKGTKLIFEGFYKVTGYKSSSDEQVLPELKKSERLDLKEIKPTQHFTKPPPRFSEATLIKTLEKYGIGRPSTYAPILSTIQKRGYVIKYQRKLFPSELGILVTEKLEEFFNSLINTEFTAQMEEKLDKIEEENLEWKQVLREFYFEFEKDLKLASEKMLSEKGKEADDNQRCEKCGKPLIVRWAKFGKFYGCSGYPDCNFTKSLNIPEVKGEKCSKCGVDMIVKYGRRGFFLACSTYPKCKFTKKLPPINIVKNIQSDEDGEEKDEQNGR